MHLLILASIFPTHSENLSARYPNIKITYALPSNVTKEQLEQADAVFGNPPLSLLRQLRQFPKWIHLESAGADAYTKPGILPQDTLLTNSTGAYGPAIAEHALGMLFGISKKLFLYRDEQLRASWNDLGTVKPITGTTTLILGAGDIGCEFAKRVQSLGSYTVGIRRTGSSKPDCLDELYHTEALDRLLPSADTVFLSLPNTPETYHMINRSRIASMKRDAVLLNVGRGAAIDTEALCDLLEGGHLMGAGLDVTDPEPLPKGHRLWNISNVFITPHISGGGHLAETTERIFSIFQENLGCYLNGKPLKNIVDFTTGYRKLTEEETL